MLIVSTEINKNGACPVQAHKILCTLCAQVIQKWSSLCTNVSMECICSQTFFQISALEKAKSKLILKIKLQIFTNGKSVLCWVYKFTTGHHNKKRSETLAYQNLLYKQMIPFCTEP